MSVVVQKYGGSSLATIDHIKRIAGKIAKEQKETGNSFIVVLSAMSGETDRLLNLYNSIIDCKQNFREQDVILSIGEQLSVALMAVALENAGSSACSFLGWQIPFNTDHVHSRSRILSVETEKIKTALEQGKIVVAAGFQGIGPDGNITTLGRGGSDTTAVAIAAAIQADVCEIYTDVDGVYTADPNICPDARHLARITYEEILEMSGLGAKVLQIRSVELARKFQVPLLVKSSFGGDRCTWIIKEDKQVEDAVISGITMDRNEAKISVLGVPDQPSVACKIISPLAEKSINVDMIIQNVGRNGTTDFTFTVPLNVSEQAKTIVEEAARETGAEGVRTAINIVKVSVVGLGVKNHPGVAAKMFKTLGDENINIQMISTSEFRISCVIAAKYGELAVRVLHDAFELNKLKE